jgi:flagellar hook-length control protein FliK
MTSASVVTGSSAVQPGSGSGKTRSPGREEEETGIPLDFHAFADLFSQLTGEELPAVPLAPAAAPAVAPAPTPAPADSREESSPLQMAATHSQWFGSDEGALAEPVMRRKPPMLIREAISAVVDAVGAAEDAVPLPPALAADLALAKQQAAVLAVQAATQQQPAPQPLPQPAAADDGAILQAQAELPRGDLLRYQAAMMRPDRPGAGSMATQQAAARAASGDASPLVGQAASKVQQSLSALQAALSERSLFGGEAEAIAERPDGLRQMMKDAGVTSVRQETFLAPPSQSPALQIAQRILNDLETGGARALEPSAGGIPVAKPPVRVLNIELSPPQLGPMTIRLSMHDEALRLHLETPNPETAKMIQNERDGLSRLLRSAGYAVDGVQVVQVAQTDRGAGGQSATAQQSFGQATGQQPSWRESQSDGRGAQRGWGGPSQQDETGGRGQDRGPSQTQPGRTTRGVYL